MPTPFDEIRNRQGERLDVTWTPAVGTDPAVPPTAAVVIGHGVTAHKDRPWLVALSEGLAAAGLASLRMSFAGNGGSEGRFEDAVPTKEAADLGAALDALERWGVGRLAYAGHSMGGAVGILRAAADARLVALVSLAGMVHVRDFFAREFGHLPFGAPMLGRAECPWSSTLAGEAAELGSLTSEAARIRIPWLLVHGDADELVPYQDSVDARAAANGRPELVTLAGVDHRFTDAIPRMVDAVTGWLPARLGA